ncbi:iron export ABC transporter permease subunit FetB [Virgibacillus phasianinus]|uniref:Iron export ABC transporter permease subunit FetB n=1 Tax=Virgibacillus phasianinus TaxID=2017483 RepID=A0A220U606_9BACI|nr:iron export ABC transporter permease subunit FetB [Virgibacillus phasianinus]ASK63412.1 iron export ABC transporter permease subunit FetB [Virgibacillus phasianinus]
MDEGGAINIGLWQLVAAYFFILLLLVIVKLKKIPREKLIVISTIRMTLQLILVGYILIFIFDHPHPMLTLVVILFMLGFAILNVYQRTKELMHLSIKKMVALSMIIGVGFSLVFFMLVVLQLDPWYDPMYFIPIGGMLIGNTMTGISLGVNNLLIGMREQKEKVEGALMLGATPKQASNGIINEAFDSAILPTINSMVGMGIVFLPGMMTGQIISGTSPLVAVEYQIAIMLGVAGTVSLTVVIFLHLAYKTFFNERQQLRLKRK